MATTTPLWQPTPGTTWQYVLQHPLILDSPTLPNHTVYILDLFDTPTSTISHLHAHHHKVIAYFSAGSYENWRPDAPSFPPNTLGRKLDSWDGERWIDTNATAIRSIMLARLNLAQLKGFDGVDPDNVDGYDNKTGLKLKQRDAVDYVLFLAGEAHARGLSIGLKNAGDIADRVMGQMQWCVTEQAVQFDEVERFVPFVAAGKAVFHVEYPKGEDAEDPKHNDAREVTGRKRERAFTAKERGFSTIIKNVRLDQWVQTC